MVISLLIIFIHIQNKNINIDELTEAYNRRYLERQLEVQTKSNLKGKQIYMLLIDVDEFKKINDNYGHLAGDEALKEIANILKYSCDNRAFVSRYGGDEFVILGQCENASVIEKNILQIEKNVRKVNDQGKFKYSISLSIGVSIFNRSDEGGIDNFLKEADKNMYEKKIARYFYLGTFL